MSNIQAYCPACGERRLHIDNKVGILHCMNPGCAKPDAAHRILCDPEIHHIVRFDADGFFNVKHPLRERIDSELLDCQIHAVVQDYVHSEGQRRLVAGETWRAKVDGDQVTWEKL